MPKHWNELTEFEQQIISLLLANNPEVEMAKMFLLGKLRQELNQPDYLSEIDGWDKAKIINDRSPQSAIARKGFLKLEEHEQEFIQNAMMPFITNDNYCFLTVSDCFELCDTIQNHHAGKLAYLNKFVHLPINQDITSEGLEKHLASLASYPFDFGNKLIFCNVLYVYPAAYVHFFRLCLKYFPNCYIWQPNNIEEQKNNYFWLKRIEQQKNILCWDEAFISSTESFENIKNTCFCLVNRNNSPNFECKELEAAAASELWKKNNLTYKIIV